MYTLGRRSLIAVRDLPAGTVLVAAREALARRGQAAVDGYGALRIAFALERLASPDGRVR